MTYRTKVLEVEAYHFTGNPYEDSALPHWLKTRLENDGAWYDKSGIIWIYPHGNVISLQQARIGDYITYNSRSDEVWVEWKYEFEAKYEPA